MINFAVTADADIRLGLIMMLHLTLLVDRSLAGFQSMRDTGGRRDALRDEERNHARRDQDSRGRDRGDGERGRYRSRSRSRDRDFERRPHDRRPQHGHGRDRIDTKDAYDRSR